MCEACACMRCRIPTQEAIIILLYERLIYRPHAFLLNDFPHESLNSFEETNFVGEQIVVMFLSKFFEFLFSNLFLLNGLNISQR